MVWITYCDVLSAVYTPFIILTAPIHCSESIGEQVMQQHFSKSVLIKKQTRLHLGWPEGEYILTNLFFLDELFL